MPSYIELDKNASFPSASGEGRVILGVDTASGLTLTTNSGSIIPVGGIISTTRNEISQSIINGSLMAGSSYRITDADNQMGGLYGGTEIIVQAVSTSSLSPKGVGKFYNPKYNQDVQGFGIWDPLVRFETSNQSGSFQYGESYYGNGVSQSYVPTSRGIVFDTTWDGGYNYVVPDSYDDNWTNITSLTGSSSNATIEVTSVSQQSYASGSTTIWGGKVWGNLSGSIGNNGMGSIFELNSEDWVAIPYNETDYNVSWDEIEYDLEHDFISMRREASTGNIVEQTYQDWQNWEDYRAILVFQWGNPYKYNSSRGRWIGMAQNRMNNSMFTTINFGGERCVNNELKNYSYFGNCYFEGNIRIDENIINDSGIYECFFSGNNGYFRNNILNNSSMGFSFMAGYASINNNVLNDSFIGNNSLIYSDIYDNFLINSYIGDNYLQYGCNIENNTLHSATIGDGTNRLTNYSNITTNTIFNQSYISDLTMNQNTIVGRNNLTADSYIEGMIVSSSAYIEYNNLSSDSGIYGARVENTSYIRYNTLASEAYIGGNTVINSNIDNNVINCSGIYDNNMSSASISIINNTINNSSQINANILDNGATINNCALFNAATITGETTSITNSFFANLP